MFRVLEKFCVLSEKWLRGVHRVQVSCILKISALTILYVS